MSGPDVTTEAAPSEGPAAPDPRAPRGALVGRLLPWLVAVAAIVVAVVLGLQLRAAQAAAGAVDEVAEVAGLFATELTTWDATDGMGDTREQLRARATESFAEEVDELFGGSDDLAGLEELGARSTSEVTDVLVSRIDGDEAEAVAVVVQRVTTAVTEGEEVSERFARMSLRRGDGDWRIDDLELVVDALQEAATPTEGTEAP